MRVLTGLGLACVLAGSAMASDVPTEVAKLNGQVITLHVYPFLTESDLKVLRLVQTNKQALALFVTSKSGYSAIAMAPKEGFQTQSGLAASVVALGDLPDAAAAAEATLKGCDAARKGGEACVVVLEVAPGK